MKSINVEEHKRMLLRFKELFETSSNNFRIKDDDESARRCRKDIADLQQLFLEYGLTLARLRELALTYEGLHRRLQVQLRRERLKQNSLRNIS